MSPLYCDRHIATALLAYFFNEAVVQRLIPSNTMLCDLGSSEGTQCDRVAWFSVRFKVAKKDKEDTESNAESVGVSKVSRKHSKRVPAEQLN